MQLIVVAVAAVALLGCEKSEPRPKQDQVDPEAARPKPKPKPAPADAVILFTFDEEYLFPVACFDKKDKTVHAGGDCIDLMPPGSEVGIGAKKVTAGPVKTWICEGDGSEFDGFTLKPGAVAGLEEEYAVYPPGANTGFVKVDENWEETEILPDALQNRIEKLIRKDLGKKLPESPMIDGYAAVDVDGDGKPEKFYTMTIMTEARAPEYDWSGFLVEYGNAPGKLSLLFKHDYEAMTVNGSMDLDGDGVRELIVTTAYYEGGYQHLATLKDGKLDLTVFLGCGA